MSNQLHSGALWPFGNTSALNTNLDNCPITPIFGCDAELEEFHSVLPNPIQQFPITNLGVPLSTRALPNSQFLPLVEKVADLLPAWQGHLMKKSGRLTLVKSTLSAMPIYLTMSNKLPPWAIKQIDSTRGNFLWTGTDAAVRGKRTVAWPTVCRPTIYVLDLRLAVVALRTRWLWLQKTHEGRSWSALNIQVEPAVRVFFTASITVQLGNGERTCSGQTNGLMGSQSPSLLLNCIARYPHKPRIAKLWHKLSPTDGGRKILAVVCPSWCWSCSMGTPLGMEPTGGQRGQFPMAMVC